MNMQGAIAGYSDGDVDTNLTTNPTLLDLVDRRYSRRQALMGSLSATAMAFLGTSLLSACGDGDDGTVPGVSAGGSGTTSSGRVFTLSGTASDEDGIGSTAWTQVSGPPVTLTSAANGTATFLAPSVSAATELKFKFTATDNKGNVNSAESTVTVSPAALGFTAVAKNRLDVVTVPAGYTVTVMTRLGDPIAAGVPAYANDGTDTNFANRIGDHGDALYWYGLNAAGARDDNASTRGLMVQNHENITESYLHPNGPTSSGGARPEAEVIKEIEAHGVSVVEYRDAGNRQWSYVQDSPFNRRLTPNTPMAFNGPVRTSDWLKTPFSPPGTEGRGTINNCANGHTLWGTNITCEENWAGYFRRSGDDAQRTARELTALRRYGVTSSTGSYSWSSANTTDTAIKRWDARATVGGTATTDWRNEPNQFGWAVELDPYDKTKTPRKRTALGRMGHEGAWFGQFLPGKKLAVYLGDDAINEYFYKYVSNASWSAGDAQAADRLAIGDKYLDDGKLYVAKFNENGSGTWIELKHGSVPNRPADGLGPEYVFADQNDILVNPRLAADAVGATPMDRPEWTATNNVTGEIYLTLTNNGNRRVPGDAANAPTPANTFAATTNATYRATDATNPRVYVDPPSTARGNRNGHILRLRESGDDPAATTFAWDIYLFGADSAQADPANVNLSGLNANNDFSSPDGLWFARPQNASGLVKPVLWIQTDDSAFTDVTNNQMLAAMPGTTGDGTPKTIITGQGGTTVQQATRPGAVANDATLKRFLVGPVACEITGVDTTPDGRTLFVGIQHPGEGGTAAAPNSNWPATQNGQASNARPRSAIVAITKTDGGVVAL